MTEADRRIRQIIEAYFGEDLDESVFAELQPHSQQAGEWLFRQGDPGDSLYFVVRGRLQAWSGSGAADDKQGRLLGDLLPGDSVGEAGLLTGATRAAGVKAIRDSLLIRLDKASFESLAMRHPAMVMRLAANVAAMMQKNLASSGDSARGFRTITLLALHDRGSVRRSLASLSGLLEKGAGALVLDPGNLKEMGAPKDFMGLAGELPDAMKQWLADLENDNHRVVYQCKAEDSPWTRFALRQADLVLMLVDADESPELTPVEEALFGTGDATGGRRILVLVHPEDQGIRGTREWLSHRDARFHLHVRNDERGDLERVARIVSGAATGLVLGAGAVPGLAVLGVYKALWEAKLPIDWVGGCSIGALAGAGIARDWEPQRIIGLAREVLEKSTPFDEFSIPVISAEQARQAAPVLHPLLDGQIEDLPLPFFCVSSNLDRGELQVHERGPLQEAIRASCALPGVLPPAFVGSEMAVDGSVLNNLPVDIMQQRPVHHIVAVDVSSRAHRTATIRESASWWQVVLGRFLPFLRRQQTPGLATAILRSTEIGALAHARERGLQADLLIAPPVDDFGITDIEAFDEIVEAGYREAKIRLESLGD
jgi:predicted acylesterase/phospholipase RssA/CRP-like cAMP-binding protein